MLKRLVLLFSLVCLAIPIFAQAEEDTTPPQPKYTLEEVLVTASRIVEPPLKLPAQITIIDGKELRMHGVSQFSDISYLIPTSDLSSFGYLGGLSTLSIRGARSEQTLFLLDGRPVNDPQNGIFNLSTVPLCLLHRIEIIRGGASSLWGANAMGGVVNLVTKRFGEGLPYSRIALKNGSYNTSMTELEFGRRIGEKVSLFISSELKKSGGFRTNSDYDGTNIGGNLSLDISELWEVGIGAKRYEGKLGIPGDTIYFPSPKARENDYRFDADIKLKGKVPGKETEIQVFGSYLWNEYRNPDLLFGSHEVNQNKMFGVQMEQKFPLFSRYKGTFGLYGEEVIGKLKTEEHKPSLISGFLQFEWNLTQWINLFTSTRLDCHSVYGRQLSPSIGATLSLRDKVVFYLNWNRSFRAPTLNELYYPGFGNPNLEPERSTGIESGLKMESSTTQGSIAYFRRWIKDMIQFSVENGVWAPYNIGETNIKGIELDLQVSPGDFLTAGFNFTLLEALDDAGNRLMYRPREKGGGFIEVGRTFMKDKLEGTVLVSGNFVGKRLSETDRELPGYSLLNTKFSWRILDLTFFLGLQNLLNSDYEIREGYPMPGRNHILGLEWELWD